MAKIKTYLWDPAADLLTHEDCVDYVDAALQEDDPVLLVKVLDDIARSKGMEQLVMANGQSRSCLYDSLTADGAPDLGAILEALRTLGISLYGGPRRCTTSEPQPPVVYHVQPLRD